MVQSNSIITSINTAFGVNQKLIAVVLMIVVGWILLGGMSRIAKFSETVVPVMAFAYVASAVVILILNLNQVIPVLKLIITGAFNPQAIAGGALGISMQQAIRFGLARGLFSNEAGMGSTPHSHAVALNNHPAEQGFVAMIGVFICTFVICVATVMINMLTGAYSADVMSTFTEAIQMENYAQVMTQTAFNLQFGQVGEAFLSISLSAFALTTIVGWFFFAESNVKFIFKKASIVRWFKLVGLTAIALGYFAGTGIIWDLADLAMGLMALPNIIALLILSRTASKILKYYDQQMALGEEHLSWDYKYE